MKKITLLLLVFYFTNLHAQLPTVQEYQTQQSNAWQTNNLLKKFNLTIQKYEKNYFKIAISNYLYFFYNSTITSHLYWIKKRLYTKYGQHSLRA